MTLQQLRYVIAVADHGSMNEAAKALFISQPSLSGAVKELEKELGFELFLRTSRGIVVTPDARQVTEQYRLLRNRYIEKESREKFSVSMQHYSFAVKAFVETVKRAGMENYEFAVYETRTYEIIENVRNFKSELGILYMNDMNRKVLEKILRENQLKFTELFSCDTYVYLRSGHPLAGREILSMKDLEPYPCLAFDQGKNNSFYLAEEMKSTYDYDRIIKANDRATMLNLMNGLDAYTLCSGIICEELNGDDSLAIPLKESEKMQIGYIHRAGSVVSALGEIYIEELMKYQSAYAGKN
jgi:DNA-binding transcriptional LysR family regulator